MPLGYRSVRPNSTRALVLSRRLGRLGGSEWTVVGTFESLPVIGGSRDNSPAGGCPSSGAIEGMIQCSWRPVGVTLHQSAFAPTR